MSFACFALVSPVLSCTFGTRGRLLSHTCVLFEVDACKLTYVPRDL